MSSIHPLESAPILPASRQNSAPAVPQNLAHSRILARTSLVPGGLMRVSRYGLCCISCLTLLLPSVAQQATNSAVPAQRDAQALLILNQSCAAMGGAATRGVRSLTLTGTIKRQR